MLSTSNGHLKSNGKVSPMDEHTIKELGIPESNNTNVMVPSDTTETTQEVIKTNLIYRLFKKDGKEKEKEPEEKKKKPQGPKLKTFEIVCLKLKQLISNNHSFFQHRFADRWDILFMIIGTIMGKIIEFVLDLNLEFSF